MPLSPDDFHFTRRALLACSLTLMAGTAWAQAWPSKPIKLVVPFPAGGSTDAAARIVGQKLALRLKQPVVVENKAGASGSIGAVQVAKAAPDGYTLMLLPIPPLLAPHLYKNVGYDSVKSFAPIATINDLPIVAVINPAQLPNVTDLQQLIALAKAQPGKLNYTSAGNGSFGHLAMELLKQLGSFDIQHVNYRGAAPALTDLLGGQVQLMHADLASVLPYIQSNKLRAIAVSSPKREVQLPEVKTIAEQGFAGFEALAWAGLVAPAGTPKDVVARLSSEVQQILAEKDTQDKLLATGAVVHYQGPAQMGQRLQQDYAKWGQVIRDRGISAQ